MDDGRLLARSRDGRVIHRRSCGHASPQRPWLWADTVSTAEVLEAMCTFGYRPCKVCNPFTEGMNR